MPAAIPAIIGAGASLYLGNKSNKALQRQGDIAQQGLDASTGPRRTQYGSYIGPASGFAIQPQPQGRLGGTYQLSPDRGVGSSYGGANQGVPGLYHPRPRQVAAPPSIPLPPGVNPGDRFAYIDPSIRAMREQSLANIPNYQSILSGQLGSTLSGLGQTRGRLDELYGQTNDNAFLDPILQRLAMQRGQLSRGMTDRGLGGSSFMSSALGNFESAAAPGIAQARQQGIMARQGLLGDIANTDVQGLNAANQGTAALQNLDNVYSSVSGVNLEQELAALGLSSANIAGILGAANQIGQAGQLRAANTGNTLAALGDIFGKINFGGSVPAGQSNANWL